MSVVFALGGGSFQRGETRWMDKEILKAARKTVPEVLFLPTASRDDQGYGKRFKRYMNDLGAVTRVLRLFHTKLTREEVIECFTHADIIYLGAGNVRTLKAGLQTFALQHVLSVLLAQEHKVICGISAGASVLFDYGYSDCLEDGSFIIEEGFHMVTGIFNPHAQKEERRCVKEAAAPYDLPLYSCADREMLEIHDGKILWKKREVQP